MKSIALCHYVAHPQLHSLSEAQRCSFFISSTLQTHFLYSLWLENIDPGTMELSLMAAQVRAHKYIYPFKVFLFKTFRHLNQNAFFFLTKEE